MSRFLSKRLQSLEAYVPGEQPRVRDLVKLNTNESPFPPAPGVAKAVEKAALSLQLYNDLKAERLTKLLADTYGVKENQVAVSNGSDEMLAFAFLAFGEEGLAFPDITYGFYTVWAKLFGLDAKIIPLNERFEVDVTDYRDLKRCIVIANPNAPTGKALKQEALKEIAKANPDSVLIVDEAYVDFAKDADVSALGLAPEMENVLVVRTFSKSRSLAGGRLGYAIGHEKLIGDLNRVRFSFHPYNVNTLTQAAGAAALEDQNYFEACRKTIMENREWTKEQLTALGFSVMESETNFLFAACPRLNGAQYQQKLREKSILIRYFDQDRIRDYVRITIGSREQMEKLIAATKEILS